MSSALGNRHFLSCLVNKVFQCHRTCSSTTFPQWGIHWWHPSAILVGSSSVRVLIYKSHFCSSGLQRAPAFTSRWFLGWSPAVKQRKSPREAQPSWLSGMVGRRDEGCSGFWDGSCLFSSCEGCIPDSASHLTSAETKITLAVETEKEKPICLVKWWPGCCPPGEGIADGQGPGNDERAGAAEFPEDWLDHGTESFPAW